MPRGGVRSGAPRMARCGHLAPFHPGPPSRLCPDCAAPIERACQQCGADITGTGRRRFCSTLCQEIASGARLAQPLPRRVCALDGCGVEFQPARRMQLCCSERHGKTHYNRVSRADGRQKNPPWDERRRAHWKKRYALSRGAADAETFDYLEVFERDGWVCGLCRKDVDPDCQWPDPMSPSLDHIVPVVLGGKHTRENAQLAHLTCNIRKGAAIAA